MIDMRELTAPLIERYGVNVTFEHTGGGNFVILIGNHYGISEDDGVTRADINVGPVYLSDDRTTYEANRADLYFVSIHENRADEVIHTAAQMLPAALSMLGIEDVNVSDAGMDLDEIATALGDGWSVGCLGGNNYGAVRADGTMVTLDEGHRASFLPAHVIVGRQSENDEEWSELYSGPVWEVSDIVEIVTDRA